LARPGGNITGLTRLTRELSGKRLELFKEVLPAKSLIGVLGSQSRDGLGVKEYEVAARALKIPLQLLEVREANVDLERPFQTAKKGRVSALIVVGSSLINGYRNRINELAIKNRMPSMHETRSWVEAGGMMSCSSNDVETFRHAAVFVDKILKGAKPADLPVEQPMRFEFVINLQTAKKIGLNIPQSVLFRADKVIK
jgi:putative ABC transport system substrate-binding protein